MRPRPSRGVGRLRPLDSDNLGEAVSGYSLDLYSIRVNLQDWVSTGVDVEHICGVPL